MTPSVASTRRNESATNCPNCPQLSRSRVSGTVRTVRTLMQVITHARTHEARTPKRGPNCPSVLKLSREAAA